MRRWCGLVVPFLLGASFLCAYVPPQDRQYVDYFLRLQAADLFRKRSFLLTHSWSYVGRDCLERVDLRFSFYRALTMKQARELLVTVAQEIVSKINNDPSLHERKLLPDPFRVCQLRLELTTDNVFTLDPDCQSIHRMVLDNGVITYETCPPATLFCGSADTFEETYLYAVMQLGLPSENLYLEEISCGATRASNHGASQTQREQSSNRKFKSTR
jgi:hypothetical protein